MDIRVASIHIKLMWVAIAILGIFCGYHELAITIGA